MSMRTPLYPEHEAAGGRIVDFAGWDMPVHYGSQIEEHHAVRRAAGMFDVSHMTVVDLAGARVRDYLRYVFANDVNKLAASGRAMYSCMLNEHGGVIDDLIVYYRDDSHYRAVVNAATREKDLAWLNRHASDFDVSVTERADLAMIAVQGPQARQRAAACLPAGRETALGLKPFSAAAIDGYFVARTGYTGEDGFEIILPGEAAPQLWRSLAAAGVVPCGLGARDTLRLEAGMNLYGQDMDETVSPLESGLAWTIAWEAEDRRFIGRDALERQKSDGVANKFVGLVLNGRGVMRAHQKVLAGDAGEGETTSGTFSPTMGRAIALARVPAATGDRCDVEIRGRRLPAVVVKPPFVRNGQIKVNVD